MDARYVDSEESVESSLDDVNIVSDANNSCANLCKYYERVDLPWCVSKWLHEHLTQRPGGDMGIEPCDLYGSPDSCDSWIMDAQIQYLIEENELICCLLV